MQEKAVEKIFRKYDRFGQTGLKVFKVVWWLYTYTTMLLKIGLEVYGNFFYEKEKWSGELK